MLQVVMVEAGADCGELAVGSVGAPHDAELMFSLKGGEFMTLSAEFVPVRTDSEPIVPTDYLHFCAGTGQENVTIEVQYAATETLLREAT